MKTLLVIIILLLPVILLTMPHASAHGICTGLQSRYVRTLYPAVSKQSVRTGEIFTITGNVTALTDNDLKGQLFLQTEPGYNGRFVVTSIEPSGGVFDIQGNSGTPYSVTVKSLVPGNYYVTAGINLAGIGKSLINNGCPVEPNIAVTGTPMCTQGMVAVSKAEDGSIFCVMSGDAQNLVQRGWAKEIVPSVSITEITPMENKTSSDALELLLSTNSSMIKTNQALGIDITLNNTSSSVLVKDSQNNWSMQGLSMSPCEIDPVGIGVYEGNYSLENITGARPLQLYQNGTYNCQMLVGVDRYVFEPSSDKVISETPNGNSTGEMRYHTSFDGFYASDGFQSPSVGAYTVIAGDQWGHVVIRHFTVVKAQTVSNTVLMGGQNHTSTFSINSGSGSGSLSPTCPICTPEYFNETNTYVGNVGKIMPGYPILVKISDPYSMSPRTDQIAARNILPNGTFHYTINVTGKFGQNQYTLNFIYGNKTITETLPVLPP